jgi:PAS domain S-box-containing protein
MNWDSETLRPAPAGPGALADEDVLLRSLFLAYPDALLLANSDGKIVRANPAASTMLGYANDELIGLSVESLVPQASRARHADLREVYAAAPQARPMGAQMELSALHKGGREIKVEIALSPLQHGSQAYVVAALRDVGAYPRVQQVLQRARYSEHLAQLGRLAVDARDPQLVLDEVAAVAAETLHADATAIYLLAPNLLDFRLASAAGPSAGPALRASLLNRPDTLPGYVVQQGQPVKVEALRSETRFSAPQAYLDAGLEVACAVPLSDRGRTIGAIVVCARDTLRFGDDELHFVESMCNLLATCLQRAQSEDALKHAQRLETVGQLTGGIAHDFNNLLTIIQGSLQVLDDLPSMANNAQARQLVSAASRASTRGAELTSKLLAFSRRQVLQPIPVDVRKMLNSLADLLRRTLDRRIRIEVDAPPSCPQVLVDPGQLEAALLNIAVNARDAMRDGGLLRFGARACMDLPPEVHVEIPDASARELGFVAIAVSDTGCGMTEDVKRRAFEPFFTTKEAGRGTGLGLSTVYGFAKQSRGAVSLDSAPDAGTKMTLYLPRPTVEAAEAAQHDAPDAALPQGRHVLLVDDDADVRAVVRAFLVSLGCRVTSASSGEQALLAFNGDVPIDLLLSDIVLGAGMRGTQLAAQAQQMSPAPAVLLMSAYSAALLDADRDSPANWGLLQKPFTRNSLATALSALLAPCDDAE